MFEFINECFNSLFEMRDQRRRELAVEQAVFQFSI